MFTIGIDINALTRKNMTGTERYVFELLSEMKKIPLEDDERVLLYSSAPVPSLDPLPAGWSFKILNWWPRKGWTHGRLSWELIRRTPNVFFTPAHEIPRFHGRLKIVSTVHDAAFRRTPQVYSSAVRRRQEWAVGRAINESAHLITVSKTTKRDLIELYRVPAEKITATPLAVDLEDFQTTEDQISATMQKYRIARGRYFVTIGRIEHKKNILTLLRAFEDLKYTRGAGDPTQLLLGGTFGNNSDDIKIAIAQSPARKDILLPGYIVEEDLAPLIAGSAAYVFPSWYEGFGITALEALAAGTVLIASDIPALREVAGDAAIFADPKSITEWRDAMLNVALNKIDRQSMIDKGMIRLDSFSWSQTAEQTWQALRNLKPKI
ncbi:MAG: glycosyltransferase family 1 protein [bacterium]